jgi:hypothetical protein
VTLDIAVLDVAPEPWAAVPTLRFSLQITERSGEPVHALALQCQIRIEPQRRGYTDAEQARLLDLFGRPEQWATTRTPFPWTHESLVVPGFTGVTEVDLQVACTYDLEVVATKYLHALEDGEVPLLLLFAGTMFTRGQSGFSVQRISWDLEARHQLPVRVWGEVMDHYFPGSGWLRLDRTTLRRLQQFKAHHGLTTWEQTVQRLLEHADDQVAP